MGCSSQNKWVVLCLLFLLSFGPVLAQEPSLDDLGLDSSPVSTDESWEVFYLKASYRQYYTLIAYTSEDRWSVPLAGGLGLNTRSNELINQYTAESKIYVNDRLSSTLRFDYYFQQSYLYGSGEYVDAPHVTLHEAYLDYRADGWTAQVGGILLPLGRVDFESPIDVLTLKDQDKSLHLDSQGQRLLMPALKVKQRVGEMGLEVYWAPFQRLSEESTSLRSHVGVILNAKSGSLQWDVGLFNWLDPDSELSLKFQPDLDDGEIKPILVPQDAPLHFGFFSFDLPWAGGLLKGDLGVFQDKSFYHVLLKDDGEAVLPSSELKTHNLASVAMALSYERRQGDFFWMPSANYWKVEGVPAGSVIYGFENPEQPNPKKHNLNRGQLAFVLGLKMADQWEMTALGFSSAPYQRSGVLLALNSEAGGQEGWQVRLSQVGTEKDNATNRITRLQRVQVRWTTRL